MTLEITKTTGVNNGDRGTKIRVRSPKTEMETRRLGNVLNVLIFMFERYAFISMRIVSEDRALKVIERIILGEIESLNTDKCPN